MNSPKLDRTIKLKIEKSDFPDAEGTHLLVQYTSTEHGWGYRRLFKGTHKECMEKKNEMEDLKNGAKRKNPGVSRKK